MKRVYDKVYSVNGKELKVKSYKGVKCNKWGGERYRFKILLSIGEKSETFSFYGSEMEFENGICYISDMDFVIDAITSDAISHIEYPKKDTFIKAFGYDDYKDGECAFEGCKKTFFQLRELGLTNKDIMTLNEQARQ